MFSKIFGTSFNQGAALAIIALVIGAITGWIGILSNNTVEHISKVARVGYFVLALILPLALYFLLGHILKLNQNYIIVVFMQ